MIKKSDLRNSTIDIFKAISAYMVITIHYGFPFGGTYMNALARVAVPFFFMVSGYYCCYDKLILRIKHTIFLIVCGESIYCIFYYIYHQIIRKEVTLEWFWKRLSFGSFIKTLSISEGFFDISWFLFGLFYMYVFYMVVYRLHLFKIMYILIPCVLLGWIFAQRYVAIYPNAHWLLYFYRLHIVKAFPFFAGGYLLEILT